MDWELSLPVWDYLVLDQSTPLICWWRSLSDHICSMIDGNRVCFLLALWWYYFPYILKRCIGITHFISIRARFLSSYWNLIRLLLTIRFLNIRFIQRLLIDWSFLAYLILQILVLIIWVILNSGVVICMILFHNVFKQLLYGIWTFGIQVLCFFHLLHLKVHFLYKAWELILIGLFVGIKLENSLLQNVQKTVETVIVCFLLLTGGKPWVYGHVGCLL